MTMLARTRVLLLALTHCRLLVRPRARQLSSVISRLNLLPVLVYAAKLCPEDVEASMFAIFMGMANLGNDTGFYLGSGLLRLLGGVNAPDFENLTEYVILRALARLIPTALIPFLVPAGGPADTAVDMGAGIGVTGTVETTNPSSMARRRQRLSEALCVLW